MTYNFTAGESVTGKRFQVDTGATLMANLRCFWPLSMSYSAAGSFTRDLMGVADLAPGGGSWGWDSDGPSGSGAIDFEGSSYTHSFPDFVAEGIGAGANQHVSFFVSAWVRIDATGVFHSVIGRWETTGSKRGWAMTINDSNNARFVVSPDGTASTTATASSFGALSANTWYNLVGWHDATADEVGISVNGTSDTAAHTTGVESDDNVLEIGAGDAGAALNGNVADVGYWVRTKPTSTEITDLYNSGNGNTLVV